MKCPKCRLENPKIAQRCDCGYDFDSKKIEKPYIKNKEPIQINTNYEDEEYSLDVFISIISKKIFRKEIKKLKNWQRNIVFAIVVIFFIILILIAFGLPFLLM